VSEATGPRRAVVGPLMMAVGAIHVAMAPILFPRSVRSLVDGGVIASVEADQRRRNSAAWASGTSRAASHSWFMDSPSPSGNGNLSRCRPRCRLA
jgi:hypothetical protein